MVNEFYGAEFLRGSILLVKILSTSSERELFYYFPSCIHFLYFLFLENNSSQSLITSPLIVFQTNNRTPFSLFKKHKHC